VSKARQLGGDLMALDREHADDRGRGIGVVRYSLGASALAVTSGAAVSLVAAGNARIIVWCAVAGLISLAAGLLRCLASS